MNKASALFVVAATLLVSSLSSCAPEPTKPVASESSQQVEQSAPPNSNDAYANIPIDEIQQAGTDVEFLWEANDPFYGFNKYPLVARVHIDSIDGGRSFSPISNQYVFPQTFGKMSVRGVYKGDIEAGAQLNYSRAGGTVSYDDYWNTLNPAQQQKMLDLNGGQKPTHAKYIQAKITDDVDVEVGKDYIVFLQPQAAKDGNLHEYSIAGYQYGLREAKGDGAETTVLNNETQAWESLGSFVTLP